MMRDEIRDAVAAATRGEVELAIRRLRPLAEAGDPEAQYQLGFLALTECELISGREERSVTTLVARERVEISDLGDSTWLLTKLP